MSRFSRSLCLTALAASLQLYAAPAAHPATAIPTAPQAGPAVEGVSSFTLANGMQLLLVPDQSQTSTLVTVNYRVGSRDELYGESGSAHLLEHMLFLGTPKVPNPRDEFRKRGMNQNATTWDDRTIFYESFASGDCPASAKPCMSNLEWSLMMEADRMVNASVSPQSLAKEMTVVRNELERGENSPGNVLQQRLKAVAFRYNKYREPTIGNRSDVEHVDLDRLRALYKRYYRPDNATVTIAGNFDRGQVLQWVQKYFGTVAKPKGDIERRRSTEPAQDGERSVTLRRPGDVPFILTDYHVPSCTHPDYAPLAVLAYLIGNNADGRIQKNLVEPKIAQGGGANVDCLADPGLFQASLVLPKDGDMDSVERKFDSLLENDLLGSIKDDEIARAIDAYANGSRNAMNNVFNLAGMVGSGATQGDWRLPFFLRDELAAVKPADVRRVAAQYLKAANRTQGRFIPTERNEAVDVAQAPDVAMLLKDYHGHAAVAEGEKFDASIANIKSRMVTGTLPNGLKYALLPRKLRGEKIYINLNARFGDISALMGLETTGGALDDLLGEATLEHDKVSLRAAINQLKSTVHFDAGPQGITASLNTERGQLEPALSLMREMLRQPAFAQSDFDVLKGRMLENLETSRKTTDPDKLASRAISKHFTGQWPVGDLRHYMTFDEEQREVSQLTLDAAKSFYDRFYGVSEGEVMVIGDFDAEPMKAMLAKLFGDWRGKAPYQYAPKPYMDVKPAYFRINTADRANAVYTARANLEIGHDAPDRLAAEVANSLLGSGDKSRLFQRIRTQEGLSYGIYSSVAFGRVDKWGSWRINGTFAPENREKVETLVKEEIERARRDGFTQQELDDLKTGWLQNMNARRASEGYELGMMERLLHWDEPLERDTQEIDNLQKLTLAQVNDALRKHFDPSRLTVAVAGNFNGSAAAPKKDTPAGAVTAATQPAASAGKVATVEGKANAAP